VSAIIVGGEPIARGPNFAQEIAELLRALVERVRSEQAHRENPGS
jgi:hypothetical protein